MVNLSIRWLIWLTKYFLVGWWQWCCRIGKGKRGKSPKECKGKFTELLLWFLSCDCSLTLLTPRSLTRKKTIRWEQMRRTLLLGKQLVEVICSQSGSWWQNKLGRSEKALMWLLFLRQVEDQVPGRYPNLETVLVKTRKVKRGVILQHSELVKHNIIGMTSFFL